MTRFRDIRDRREVMKRLGAELPPTESTGTVKKIVEHHFWSYTPPGATLGSDLTHYPSRKERRSWESKKKGAPTYVGEDR